MRIVRFVRGWSPYQAGEVAGLPDELAESLISAGLAVPYEEPEPEAGQADRDYDDRQLRPRRR